ncbi:helix-turn-helix transcriptional regulator [Streptomyces carpaticus]|uniref:helix-turn-helix domain-containing protein n=1 Tax=Streptomyces carpaticus TaxID=285558 RepID=UPI0021FA96B8|nr:helix-turn-helix transcriptional regulator [Streptomyces carpaticus]
MTDTRFGSELRRLREEAGLSLARLAQKIHYSKGHLSKIERGDKQPPPQLARLCDTALNADGRLTALAAPQGEGVRRRSAMRAGAASVLVARAAASERNPGAATSATPEEGASLTFLRSLFDQFRQLGQVAGPRAVLPALTAQTQAVTDQANRTGEPVRQELFLLGSRYAEFTGWMAQEAGDSDSAQRWTDHAVGLAEAGGDRDLAHYALVRRALITMYAGDADATVTLARAAQRSSAPPRIRGLAALREAQGHALDGSEAPCRRALDRARHLLSRDPGDSEAPVIGTSHVGDPAAMAEGWCLYDLGRPAEAAAALDRQLGKLGTAAMRSRARFGIRRALAHATAGEIDHACEVTDDLLRSVDVVDSATIGTDLRRLHRELNRFATHGAVRELSPRITASLRPAG